MSEQQMSKYDLSSHQSWRTLLLGRQRQGKALALFPQDPPRGS